DALALTGSDDRDRHQIGREGRPRLVLELRHVAAEIIPDLHGLVGGDDQIVAGDLADDAEPLETHADRAQMLDAGTHDADRRARYRGEPDQRADLDMVGL